MVLVLRLPELVYTNLTLSLIFVKYVLIKAWLLAEKEFRNPGKNDFAPCFNTKSSNFVSIDSDF